MRETYGDMMERKIAVANYHRVEVEEKMFEKAGVIINQSYKLTQFLNLLTKNELQELRIKLQVNNVSHLPKNQLAEALAFTIRGNIKTILANIGISEYHFITEVIRNGGEIPYETEYNRMINNLRGWGIAFAGTIPKRTVSGEVCIIPREIRGEIAAVIKRMTFIEERSNRELWMRIICGLLHYYGVMESIDVYKFLKKLIGKEIDKDFYRYVYNNSGFGEPVQSNGHLFYHPYVLDPEGLYLKQRENKNIDYLNITLEGAIEASHEGFTGWNKYDKKLQDYLIHRHKIDDGRAFYIIEDIRYMFNNNFMEEPYSYIEKYIETNDNISMKPIIKMIDDIKYNMNLWWQKGNSSQMLNKK